ncbi:unnamed protein product [Phytomonas sp. EM1]|nr:unnamed protein product [Phytomonas sp. EM1]|eukprot:CCW60453.1 unnamed protein product [Phytomonas sp. isolate EM1]
MQQKQLEGFFKSNHFQSFGFLSYIHTITINCTKPAAETSESALSRRVESHEEVLQRANRLGDIFGPRGYYEIEKGGGGEHEC